MDKNLIDAIDRKLLFELDKNSRIPIAKLATKIKRSREATKYRISQLQRKKILQRFITAINPNKLGYHIFKAYLKLENNPTQREQFFAALQKNRDVSWVGISTGAFDVVFSMLAKSTPEFYEKINKLLSEWEKLLIGKVLGLNVHTEIYSKKFLTNEKEGTVIAFDGKIHESTLDLLDYKLLTILSTNARTPLVELAQKTKANIETIKNRIRKMEQNGVIQGYRIEIDYTKLGYEFFKANIYFRTISPQEEMRFSEWMKTHPHIVNYIQSLAGWDAEIEFMVENYHQFNDTISQLRNTFPKTIRNYEHLLIVKEIWMPAYNMLQEKA